MANYKTSRKILGGVSLLFKILIVFIFVFPFLWMVSIALQTEDEIMQFPATLIPARPQFVNFVTAWNKIPFLTFLKNSVVITASILILNVLIMVPAAYGFAKYNFFGKNFLFALVLIAFMTPIQATFIPIYYQFANWKLLKTLWPQILPFAVDAFGIFLLRQYFMQVSDELIEAAKLDNASELKVIFKIMLPLSKAALTTSLLFSFVNHWNDYFWPLVVTTIEKIRPLTVGVMQLKDAESLMEWHIIMAGNLMLVLPIIIVYLFCNKYIIRAFAYNGVK